MKSNYQTRAQKFVRDFYPYIQNCYDRRAFQQATNVFNYEHRRKVKMAYGMTRIAFITSDYVIKINFAKEKEMFERFGDCEQEIETYEEAEQDGYEYLFAKIERYEYMEHYFYIMPRVYGIGTREEDADCLVSDDEGNWLYEHVCDLHNKNYGWKNGHIVIFDYACSPDNRYFSV